ncbi:DUF3310 domain-containing protein [Staphylococcus hominis]|uniref:DUF3310 domain-containing protein n=1 Tax=Staphylococcus hominis TaxID=1290 RepID=UPI002878AF63|nr:DUF3310 domain-containing protein [Staphylococcus hominis]MDS3916673.1 DUF3310 domain-containing protein [Staphylococcus hominis]
MIISELMRNDVIRIYTHDKLRSFLAIVDESGATNQKYGIYFWAKVETEAGRKIEIDDTWDFVKVNEPFTRRVDMQKEQDSNIPNHYKGSENIDVIDFLYQQLPFEQFKGFMKGNMIKYPVRAGRKDDELADIKKARDYADRLIEKMEAEQ